MTSSTVVTGTPASAIRAAVLPVETSSTPAACRPWASSATPVLSDTLTSARRTGIRLISGSSFSSRRMVATYSGFSTAWMRSRRLSSSSPGSTSTGCWASTGPVSTPSSTQCTVTPVVGTAAASASRIACAPGKSGSSAGCVLTIRNRCTTDGAKTRMKPAQTTRSGRWSAERTGEGQVPLRAVGELGQRQGEGGHADGLGPGQRGAAGPVRADRDDLGRELAGRDRIQQRLQRAARAGGEDDQSGGHAAQPKASGPAREPVAASGGHRPGGARGAGHDVRLSRGPTADGE